MKKRIFSALVAVLLMGFSMLCPNASAESQRLSIATAGTTGVFYTYGGALASLISKYVPGVTATAESTGGSVENMRLLESREADIATIAADVVYQGYYGYKESKYFKNKIDVRALFNMYMEPLHIVTLANSDIHSIQDIKGKRVVVGSPGSGTEVKTRKVLSALGITYKDFSPEFLSFAEGTEALKDGNADVAFLGVSYPAPAVVNLAFTNPIRMISLDNDQISKIIKANPSFYKSVIPANTYKGVDQDTQTVAVQTVLVCRPDLPDELVYNIVNAVFEHKDELNMIHSSFKQTTLQNATPTVVPVHPGAKKYYEEKGVYKEQK